MTRSYYGRPVVKPPVWTWEVPTYFFAGGLAGASAGLAFGAELAGNDRLARSAWLASLGGVAVSPALLVSDLGRPERFLNMLRVFKPTSPMSVGSWLLAASGGAIAAAAGRHVTGIGPRGAGAAAALLGLPLSTYTAALVANTAIPAWYEARRELPFLFGGSAMASAGAAATIATPVTHAGPARRLVAAGALVELAAERAMRARLGELGTPYESGAPGRLSRLARACTAAGAVVCAAGGRRDRRLAVAGGGATLAGSLLERWAVYRAGFASARDPEATIGPQRSRLAAQRDR